MRMLIAATALIAAVAHPAAAQGIRETVLYNFGASPTDATFPNGPLLKDTAGRLYGVSQSGGTANFGTVYRLTPPAISGGAWTEDILFSFHDNDGETPISSLVMDAKGSLYGVTLFGGVGDGTGPSGGGDSGVVYRLTPPATGTGRWTQTVLYDFTGRQDGGSPSTGLLMGTDGTLYGLAQSGGDSVQNCGVAYALSPPHPGATAWTQTVLYTFGVASGCSPQGPLVADGAGLLYGSAETLGPNAGGLVFALVPPATGGSAWSETVIHAFAPSADGSYPNGGLIFAPDGTLFGTNFYGGNLADSCSVGGCGTVFALTPPAPGAAAWTETQLFAFDATNGRYPASGVIRDRPGNLYGTTSHNGHYGNGVAYKLTPPAPGATAWTETLHKFGNTTNEGKTPSAPLIFGPKGLLYGTTLNGGTHNAGVAFSLRQ